ncbi:MAG TPA: hypothetical protein VE135_05125 [Pyrinomonadaceae bacterium]|nr:hypothetical protein [Pyrinomonadaceae bacterium]
MTRAQHFGPEPLLERAATACGVGILAPALARRWIAGEEDPPPERK